MGELTLDAEQRKRAEDTLKKVRSDEATQPQDIVDEWKPQPRVAFSGESMLKWVSLSDVVGTDPYRRIYGW